MRARWNNKQHDPTAQLYQLSCRWNETPKVEEVERLVAAGADVSWQPAPHSYCTLHHFAIHPHSRPALLACLGTARAIDFTVRNAAGSGLLHDIGSTFSRADATAVLQAVVRHLRGHAGEDRIDWGATDGEGREFAALAAERGLLSSLFPLVREEAYFSQRQTPIPLGTVWPEDWAALPTADRRRFSISPSALQKIKNNNEQGKQENHHHHIEVPVPSTVMERVGLLGTAEIGLHINSQTEEQINQTSSPPPGDEDRHETPPLPLYSPPLSTQKKSVAPTISSSSVGEVGGVHLPELHDVSLPHQHPYHHHHHHTGPISSPRKGWPEDLVGLMKREGVGFDERRGEEMRSSGALWRLSQPRLGPTAQLYEIAQEWDSEPDVGEVERLVAAGADVNWRPEEDDTPTLVQLGCCSRTKAILACLKTENPIHFCLAREDNFTLVHQICLPTFFPLDDAVEVLRAMVLHLERHPLDTLNWGQKWQYKDFIHYAAKKGRLAAFYPIVRDQPYFGDRVKPIQLRDVAPDDWAALSKEDRENFVLVEDKDDDDENGSGEEGEEYYEEDWED